MRNKIQEVRSRAARVITGATYGITSADVLGALAWGNLDIRRSFMKSVLM